MKNAELRPTLILMLKEPSPGRVKTRLGREIGMIPATWWFRHQTARLIRHTLDPRWQSVIALAPDHAVQTSRAWPVHLPKWPQGQGDLGQRMARALTRALPGPVLLVGGDIPGIARPEIAKAFQHLRQKDVVLGPAPDGGFWCVGLAGPHVPRGLFRHVRWSTEHALADTLDGLRGQRVAMTTMLQDVDTFEDLAPSAIHATPLRMR